MISFEDLFRNRFGRSPTPEELKTLIDQSVTSFNQSGGITAHTVNVGPQPRVMTENLKQQILRDVRKDTPITVVAVMGDAEAFQLAKQLHAFLVGNGFSVSDGGVSQAIYGEPIKGTVFDPSKYEFIVGANLA